MLRSKTRAVVLAGGLDNENPLSLLRGNGLVWEKVFSKVDEWYATHIDLATPGFIVSPYGSSLREMAMVFPPATGIQVNMMPIKIHHPNTLPAELRGYAPQIDYVGRQSSTRSYHHVAYLTIHEGWVEPGETQRRPGLHIERPGVIELGGRVVPCTREWPQDWSLLTEDQRLYLDIQWGGGHFLGPEYSLPVDGIFLGSTVDDTLAVYPCVLNNAHELTDAHGGIEFMRNHLPAPRLLKAKELVWITDRTPHEALPVTKRVYRQFFRLVLGKISVWYSKHNTPNPLGLQPDAPISDFDKFAA